MFEALENLKHHHAAAAGGSPGPANGPVNGPATGTANGAAHASANGAANGVANGGSHGVSEEVVPTALRATIPLDQFTVPRLWYELKVRGLCVRSQSVVHGSMSECGRGTRKWGECSVFDDFWWVR